MKSIVALTAVLLLLSTSGCNSQTEKINIIKGGGMANNSLMVSFKELCTGAVEGFLNTDHLLVSKTNENQYEFLDIDTKSKEKSSVMAAGLSPDYYLEISPDGEALICNNYLVHVKDKKNSLLPTVDNHDYFEEAGSRLHPTYSFSKSNELILVDTAYYLSKYFHRDSKYSYDSLDKNPRFQLYFPSTPDSTRKVETQSFIQLGDKVHKPDLFDFKNVETPEVDLISHPKLAPERLKYFFIGMKKHSAESVLYVFDLYTRSFSSIDDHIKSYTLSPNGLQLAYVKTISGSKLADRLYICDTEGKEKKELEAYPSISGLVWNSDNSWLALSAGEKNKNDIWLVKSDGTRREQLTTGMNATSQLAWSRSGDKIAFTSSIGNTENQSVVYLTTLNMPSAGSEPQYLPLEPERELMAAALLNLLKGEATLYINQKREKT